MVPPTVIADWPSWSDLLPERDERFWPRDHEPLTMRWSKEQLAPIAERLADFGGIPSVRFTAASIARDVFQNHVNGGKGVHYSRSRDWYSDRYVNQGDPQYSYHLIFNAVDLLRRAGLVDAELGLWLPGQKGYQSTLWATTELTELLSDLVDPEEPRGLAPDPEIIILHGRDDKRNAPYSDTAETRAMRQQVRAFNQHLKDLEIRHRGHWSEIPVIRRVFNDTFDRGGRLYCHGTSYQQMSKEERAELNIIIDGTAHPVRELDFANLHARLAYAQAGKRPPDGDLYEIEGFDRALVKMAVNTLFNASSKRVAINAIAQDYPRDVARNVVKAAQRKHYRIKGYFGSDCGARFQRTDSDMAVKIMNRMIAETGRCPLPVHDSFIVADIDAEELAKVMDEVAAEHGIETNLSTPHQDVAPPTDRTATTTPHLPISTMEDTRHDQGLLDKGKSVKELVQMVQEALEEEKKRRKRRWRWDFGGLSCRYA